MFGSCYYELITQIMIIYFLAISWKKNTYNRNKMYKPYVRKEGRNIGKNARWKGLWCRKARQVRKNKDCQDWGKAKSRKEQECTADGELHD